MRIQSASFGQIPHTKKRMASLKNPLTFTPKLKVAPTHPATKVLPSAAPQISPVRMKPLEPPAVLYPLYSDEIFINHILDKLI